MSSATSQQDEAALKKARSLDAWTLYTSIYDEFFGGRDGKYELSPAALLEFSDRLRAQILGARSERTVASVDLDCQNTPCKFPHCLCQPSRSTNKREDEPGRIPALEATRINADYWLNAGRQQNSIEEVAQCLMQSINAWKNAAYTAHDKLAALQGDVKAGTAAAVNGLLSSTSKPLGYCLVNSDGKMWWNEECCIWQTHADAAQSGELETLMNDEPDDGWHVEAFGVISATAQPTKKEGA